MSSVSKYCGQKEKANPYICVFIAHRRQKVHFPDTTYFSVPNSVAKNLKYVRRYFVAAQNLISLGALDVY